MLREVTSISVLLRIFSAVLIGGVIGIDRGRKKRPAGLRTYMLVCVGSCLIMLTNQYIFQNSGTGDPVRTGAQVVSGIGFLGAGSIIVTKRNQIRGLTTAAGLWTSAGIGLSLGIGFYEAALVSGIAIFFVLSVLQSWDNKMHHRSKMMELYIEYSEKAGLGTLIRSLRELDAEIESIQMQNEGSKEDNVRELIVARRLHKKGNHSPLLREIQTIEGVLYAEEL